MRGIVVVVGPAPRRAPVATEIAEAVRRRGFEARVVSHRASPPRRRLPTGLATAWATWALLRYVLTSWLSWRRSARRGVVIATATWHDLVCDASPTDRDGWLLRASRPVWPLSPRAKVVVAAPGVDAQPVDPASQWRSELRQQLLPWIGQRVVATVDGVEPHAVAQLVLDSLERPTSAPPLAWAHVPVAHRGAHATATVGAAARPAIETLRPRRAGELAVRVNTALLGRRLTPLSVSPIPGLDELCSVAGIPVEGLASVRLRRAGRRLVVVAANGELVAFMKFGANDDAGLRREADLLVRLRGDANGIRVPNVIWTGTWSDRFVMITEPLVRRRGGPSEPPSELVLEVTLALAGVDCAGPSVPLVHGDLAPWNLVVTDAGPGLVDWELGREGDEPLHDLAHYVVQRGSLLSRSSPRRVVGELLADGSLGARYLERRGLAPDLAGELIATYLRQVHEPSAFHMGMWTVLRQRSALTTAR